jgi:hypothetical protein
MKYPLLFALLATPAALFAADASQTIIDRAQQATPALATPPVAPGVTVSPGDADAGNQRIAEKRTSPVKVSVSYDGQFYYTDNVTLASPGGTKENAFILAQTLSVRGEFKSVALGEGMLTPSVGLVYQRFYHGIGEDHDVDLGDFSSLDFDSFSLPFGLRYRFGANWEANLGITSNAVYGNDPATNYHQILRSHTPALSLRKMIGISDTQILSLGTSVSYAVTTADVSEIPSSVAYRDDRNDKTDYAADAAYYLLLGKWTVGPTVRVSYTDYLHYQEAAFTDTNRRDLTASLGLSLSYTIRPWASARLYSSYDLRKPQGEDNGGYAYTSKTLGLGLSLNAEF